MDAQIISMVMAKLLLLKLSEEGALMRNMINLRLLLSCLLLVFISSGVQAKQNKNKRQKKDPQLAQAIQKAQERSYKEHFTMRQRVADETNERLESYQEHDFEFKEAQKVRQARKSTLKPAKLNKPEVYFEEVGEDQSGLDGLRSQDFQDYEDENIDQELREISSLSN